MLLIDLPLIVASFWSISAFYVMAYKVVFPGQWKRSLLLMPALMAAGVALTISNCRAVIEAIFGVKTAFARTPKTGGAIRPVNCAARYRRRSGWLPFAEIAMGAWFVWMIEFAIETLNFPAIPFLLLFVAGYWWAGFGTLWQEHQGRLRWQKQRAEAQDSAEAA